MTTSLREDWAEVIASIGALLDYYERGNVLLSLGMIGYLRRRAARTVGRCGKLVDLGAGPGYMAAAAGCGSGRLCVLVDVIPIGLRMTGGGPLAERVVAMYEWLPFRDGSFGCATASFSLRDSWSAGMTLYEVRRALVARGYLVILDLGKPDGALGRFIVGAYWSVVSELLGALMGPLGPLYSRLRLTYARLPGNGFLKRMLGHVFGEARVQELLGGGVIIAVAVKSRE
ncbi:MAG: class I SAM-dependent methyltransferase [Nitrososphaeria archaeon]